MVVKHFAVISHVNISHIVQFILVYWFPSRIHTVWTGWTNGLEKAASAPKKLRDELWLFPHCPTPEVWQKCAKFKKHSGFLDGQLHSCLCERQREISSTYPAAKIKTQWGFGSQDTLHANYFTLSGALCSIMKENSRIRRSIFSAGLLDDFQRTAVCVVFPVLQFHFLKLNRGWW